MPSEHFGPRERTAGRASQLLKPRPQALSWADIHRVDEQRLWGTTRYLSRDALMVVLARALREVPVQRLEHILGGHLKPSDVGAAREQPEPGVLAAVVEFCKLARRGHFYEPMDYCGSVQSRGTEAFVARFQELLDRCIDAAATTPPRETALAIEQLVDLMRRIDAFDEEIVYFTDEGGSWQLDTPWHKLLPKYLRSLALTVERNVYDHHVDALLRDFGHNVEVGLAEPRRLAESVWRDRMAGKIEGGQRGPREGAKTDNQL